MTDVLSILNCNSPIAIVTGLLQGMINAKASVALNVTGSIGPTGLGINSEVRYVLTVYVHVGVLMF